MMKKFLLNHIPAVLYGEPSDKVFLYVHGRNGNKEVAVSFYQMVKEEGWQVLSIDLPKHGEREDSTEKFNPWTIVPELSLMLSYAQDHWESVGLCADGIGAYFALRAFRLKYLDQVLFISPMLDMAGFIEQLMEASGISEEELKEKARIDTAFGWRVSWDYYLYTHDNPIKAWNSPTEILYGAQDELVKRETVESFVSQFGCNLTIIENCGHGFAEEEQEEIVEEWVKNCIKNKN